MRLEIMTATVAATSPKIREQFGQRRTPMERNRNKMLCREHRRTANLPTTNQKVRSSTLFGRTI
jgi:hypothetical protein